MKKFSLFLVLIFCVSGKASELDQIRRGIELLYKGQRSSSHCLQNITCADQVNFDELTQNAYNFKIKYQNIINNYSRESIQLKKIDAETIEVLFLTPI